MRKDNFRKLVVFVIVFAIFSIHPNVQNASASSSVSGTDIVSYARQWIGKTPYKSGKNSLITGTDCSGFVVLIFKNFGINISKYRSSASMPKLVTEGKAKEIGTDISKAQLGDIVYFPGHVAIYSGKYSDSGEYSENGWVVHAMNPTAGTKESKLGNLKNRDGTKMKLTNIIRLNELSTAATVVSTPIIRKDGTVARFTLEAGKTYEISTNVAMKKPTGTIVTPADTIIIRHNLGNSEQRYWDYVRYRPDGSIESFSQKITNTSDMLLELSWLTTKYRITVDPSHDIECYLPYERALLLDIKSTTTPALYKFTLSAGKTYEIKNTIILKKPIGVVTTADLIIIQHNLGDPEQRYWDYISYRADGSVFLSEQNRTGMGFYFSWYITKYRITVNPLLDVECYLPYEQATFIDGIPK